MRPTTMADVQPGDQIKFAKDASTVHTVKRIDTHSWEHSLRSVETSADKSITIPANSPVFAVEQIRPFSLPCLACGESITILYDITRSLPPRGVQCGECLSFDTPDTESE